MRKLVTAAIAAFAMTGPAVAQNADQLRAQLSGQIMDLRGYDDGNNRTGETVRLQLLENGAARVRFSALNGEDSEEGWMLWRVNPRAQFCTTFAVRAPNGVLLPDDAEDCLDIAIEGNRVGLNFYGSTGNLDRYSGTLRPM